MKRIILCIFVLSCVMGSFSLNAVAETEESAKMISNWKRVLVGEPFTNNDAILKNIVLDKEKDLQDNVLSNLNKENESPSLFKNLPDWKQNSAQITETVKNIEKMAVLYQTPNSIYYQKRYITKKTLCTQWNTSMIKCIMKKLKIRMEIGGIGRLGHHSHTITFWY
ncbi:hypothetical protein ACT7DN_11090 [Bacillus paranthracis]